MTLMNSKVLHRGRHLLGEDVISQSGLYSLNLSPSIACNINTFQIKNVIELLRNFLILCTCFLSESELYIARDNRVEIPLGS